MFECQALPPTWGNRSARRAVRRLAQHKATPERGLAAMLGYIRGEAGSRLFLHTCAKKGHRRAAPKWICLTAKLNAPPLRGCGFWWYHTPHYGYPSFEGKPHGGLSALVPCRAHLLTLFRVNAESTGAPLRHRNLSQPRSMQFSTLIQIAIIAKKALSGSPEGAFLWGNTP